jgi:hypothetical protein
MSSATIIGAAIFGQLRSATANMTARNLFMKNPLIARPVSFGLLTSLRFGGR